MDGTGKIKLLEHNAKQKREEWNSLNENANSWRDKVESLDTRAREYVSEANKHRDKRDEYNKNVKEAKEKIGELNNGLKRTDMDRHLVPIKQLKRQLNDLEYTLQTQNLKKDQQADIVKKIESLKEEIKGYEKDPEQLYQKEDAETCYKSISRYVNLAQEEHEKMKSLFERSDILKKDADAAYNNFLKYKKDADAAHKEYLKIVQEINTLKKEGVRTKDDSHRYHWF